MSITSVAYQPLGFGPTPPDGGGFRPAAPIPAASPDRTHEAATGFAADISLRLRQAGEEGEDRDASPLAAALADTVDYIGEEFGSDTATAAMGIIYSRVGDGEITEDSLGKGLLGVIRLVDRNFGFEGGDKLIDRFNGDLNDTLNEYFDNGLTEQFYAVTPQTATIAQAVPHILDDMRAQWGEDLAETVADIIGQSLEDGLTMTNLRKGLARAKNHLAKNSAPTAAATLAQSAQKVLGGLGTDAAAPPVVGATLDIAV